METNKVKQIHSFGQSIWLDFIDRDIIKSGKLKKLIDEDGLRGVTSNPAILRKLLPVVQTMTVRSGNWLKQEKVMKIFFSDLPLPTFKMPLMFLKAFSTKNQKVPMVS